MFLHILYSILHLSNQRQPKDQQILPLNSTWSNLKEGPQIGSIYPETKSSVGYDPYFGQV